MITTMIAAPSRGVPLTQASTAAAASSTASGWVNCRASSPGHRQAATAGQLVGGLPPPARRFPVRQAAGRTRQSRTAAPAAPADQRLPGICRLHSKARSPDTRPGRTGMADRFVNRTLLAVHEVPAVLPTALQGRPSSQDLGPQQVIEVPRAWPDLRPSAWPGTRTSGGGPNALGGPATSATVVGAGFSASR